jgi:hypothetical protein
MALSQTQIDALTALRNGRTDDVAITLQIESELAAVALLMVPNSIAHSRTKMYWAEGESPAIFQSPRDGDLVNGWYCSWVGHDTTALETPNQLIGRFLVQYLYRYDFGTDVDNSQRHFEENCTAFLAAFDWYNGAIKTLAGKRVLSHSSRAGVSAQQTPKLHIMTAEFRVNLCSF